MAKKLLAFPDQQTVQCREKEWQGGLPDPILLFQVTNVREGGLLLNESSRVFDYPELLEEYTVKSCTLEKEKAPTNTITVHLHLSRRYEYHLFTTFLPTSLLLILGCVEVISHKRTLNHHHRHHARQYLHP